MTRVATASPALALFLGGATLVTGIVIGKVVVDQVQGKIEKASGDEPLDEAVRFVGALVGLSVTVLQIPAAWAAAQKIIQEGKLP